MSYLSPILEYIVDWLAWAHDGMGLSFWAQVAIKSVPLIGLLCVLFFVPDTEIARHREAWPIRVARTWLAIASALVLADYLDNGYAKHLVIANFFSATLGVVCANRWAARRMRVYDSDAKEYQAP